MTGNSKTNKLSLSSLASILPKSAPSTPHTNESRKSDVKDYFSLRRRGRVGSIPSLLGDRGMDKDTGSPRQKRKPKARPPPLPLVMSPVSTEVENTVTSNGMINPSSPAPTNANRWSTTGSIISRPGSVSSLSFLTPSDTTLPQGAWKGKAGRIRESSPPPERFRSHVAFDSVPAGDATKKNTASVVLNCKHHGYHASRRSRIFMVGIDEHTYSDYALEYLLSRLVDNGDHIVCVTVMEKDVRNLESSYRDRARALMSRVLRKNYAMSDSAINVTVEYAVGKLHNTFQRLIQIYQPGMLIVGTRGRSGGIQGLMGTRNSFSKYCLQYSPIPVVVVRPDEQRAKKKNKRKVDPTRGSYVNVLARSTGGIHEADDDAASMVYELESKLSKDEEAHRVAQAIGLPASFDPTLKPLDIDKYLTTRPHGAAQATGIVAPAPAGQPANLRNGVKRTGSSNEVGDDDEEEEEDEEEEGDAEFEVEAVHVTKQQKERLHMMEMGEAAALLKHEDAVEDDEDDEVGDDRKIKR